MLDTEFHAFFAQVASHMDRWAYLKSKNTRDGELTSVAYLTHISGAQLWVSRDDYRKRFHAHTEGTRYHAPSKSHLRLRKDAEASVAQGRTPEAVARELVRRLEPHALAAALELDRLEKEANEATCAHANARKTLADAGVRVGAQQHGETAYLSMPKGHRFTANLAGERVTLSRVTLSVSEAVRVFALLAEFDVDG